MINIQIQEPQWQPYAVYQHTIHKALRPWLTDPDSFMVRLKQHGVHDARIDLITQTCGNPTTEECHALPMIAETAWIREVCIRNQNALWMYARSIIPITVWNDEFATLHNQPLGSILFSKQNKEPWQRSNVLFAYSTKQAAWMRRSHFSTQTASLLLIETFLPSLMELTL